MSSKPKKKPNKLLCAVVVFVMSAFLFCFACAVAFAIFIGGVLSFEGAGYFWGYDYKIFGLLAYIGLLFSGFMGISSLFWDGRE